MKLPRERRIRRRRENKNTSDETKKNGTSIQCEDPSGTVGTSIQCEDLSSTDVNLPYGGEDEVSERAENRKTAGIERQQITKTTTFDSSSSSLSSSSKLSWRERVGEWADENISENLRFTMRVTVTLTLSTLFVFFQSPDPAEQKLPTAFWVYITAGVAAFQATPELGSVCKKGWQRFLGTVLGGILGLGVGAIALLVPLNYGDGGGEWLWRGLYLGVSQVFLAFGITYFSCRWGLRGHYATILGVCTMGLTLLAFYRVDIENAWKVGTFRVINIAFGVIVAAVSSLVVFPVSTARHIDKEMTSLIEATGTAVKEVLAETEREDPLPSFRAIAVDETVKDTAHDAYIQCIEKLHKIKGFFPLLDYDPTFKKKTRDEKRRRMEDWNLKLERILRISVGVAWLDNIVRSKFVGDDVLRSDLLLQVGENVERLLDVSSRSVKERNETAAEMLTCDLPAIRAEIARSDERRRKRPSHTVVDDPATRADDMMEIIARFDDEGHNEFVHKFIDNQTDTFYRMVEILILRCIRLHHLTV